MANVNYVILLTCFLVIASAYLKPSRTIPDKWFRREAVFKNDNTETKVESEDDQEVEASNRRQDPEDRHVGGREPGRVQIKVYRGPYDEYEKFAPHGFWVKQPAEGRR